MEARTKYIVVLLLIGITSKVDSLCDKTSTIITCQYMIEDDFKNELNSINNEHKTKLVTNHINFADFRSVKSEFTETIHDLETFYNEENIISDEFNYFKSLTSLTIYGSNISTLTTLKLKGRIDLLNLTYNNIQTVTQLCTGEYYGVEKIILKENEIKSLEPNTFRYCENLNLLDLSHNKLIIFSTEMVSNLYNLVVLDLSYNRIELFRNNHGYTTLSIQDMYLNNNNIYNLTLYSFEHFTKLRTLRLENNPLLKLKNDVFANLQLSNFYLNHVTQVDSNTMTFEVLKELDMSNENITDIPPGIFNRFTKLTKLNLQNNSLKTLQPGILHHLEELEICVFSDNELTEVPCELSDLVLSKMKLLDFSHNNISSIPICAFHNFPNLKQLRLNHNSLNCIEVDTFSPLRRLEMLNLSHNTIKILSENIIKPLRSLKILDVSSNNLSNIKVGMFSSLKVLISLYLNNNNITRIENNTFVGLGRLATLNLSNNEISHFDSGALNYLEMLTEFRFSHNRIGIAPSRLQIPCDLSNSILLHLERMDFRYNVLNSIEACAFKNFPNLKQLNLSNNYISHLPTGIFSSLSQLQTLNLSYNNLYSLKKETMIPLMNLNVLDLSWNNNLRTDVTNILSYLKFIKYMGIDRTDWKCSSLGETILYLADRNIRYSPYEPRYDGENINGISCVSNS